WGQDAGDADAELAEGEPRLLRLADDDDFGVGFLREAPQLDAELAGCDNRAAEEICLEPEDVRRAEDQREADGEIQRGLYFQRPSGGRLEDELHASNRIR